MNPLPLLGLPGGSEWLVILIVALLVFGKRLPEVARSMGRSLTQFKRGLRDVEDDIDDATQDANRGLEDSHRPVQTTHREQEKSRSGPDA